MGKNRKNFKYIFLISILSSIPVIITVFKDLLEIKEKSTNADIILSVKKESYDGYHIIKEDGLTIYPKGVKYKIFITHNHKGKESAIINSIDIVAKKKHTSVNCQKYPDVAEIKGQELLFQ